MAPGTCLVVETIVVGKVKNNELFTAHDVTLAVRSLGHRVGHNEVRDAVHDFYGRGGLGIGYTRTNITVPGGQPFLYLPVNADPATYGNVRGGAPVQTQQPATIAIPSFTSSDDDDEDDDEDDEEEDDDDNTANFISSVTATNHTANSKIVTVGRPVDRRQTLSIPSPLIRNVGFQAGDTVFAVASVEGLEVVKTQPPKSAVFSKYTVDSHQQVRLTQHMLNRAGIGGTKYDVEEKTDKVVVKLHK